MLILICLDARFCLFFLIVFFYFILFIFFVCVCVGGCGMYDGLLSYCPYPNHFNYCKSAMASWLYLGICFQTVNQWVKVFM